MATSPQPASSSDEGRPYRSFRELQKDRVYVRFSPAAKRLFWPLDGVFPAEISVMKTPRGALDDLEPFFQPTIGGGTWHEIAQMPLTEPKVSSVEATISALDQWEYDWVALHGDYQGDHHNSEYVEYGDMSDEDRPYANEAKEDGSWEEDSDTEFLIKCCGVDRPMRKGGHKLVITPSAGNDFVTVHDYVSTMHPWLMSLRPDILLAKTVARPYAYPGLGEFEWMVDQGPEHQLEEKKEWVRAHGPPPPVPASFIAFRARQRANGER